MGMSGQEDLGTSSLRLRATVGLGKPEELFDFLRSQLNGLQCELRG